MYPVFADSLFILMSLSLSCLSVTAWLLQSKRSEGEGRRKEERVEGRRREEERIKKKERGKEEGKKEGKKMEGGEKHNQQQSQASILS